MDFQSYLEELRGPGLEPDVAYLCEKAIQFNRNKDVKFGNVVILAGGAGSGKGFTISKLIQFEGKTLDVDALKTAAMSAPILRQKLIDKFGKESVQPGWLKNPENVSKLHLFLNDDVKLSDKRDAALFQSIAMAAPDRKPNLIFDVTLKDLNKLENLATTVKALGYDPKHIHLVWVLNKFEVAKAQNAARSRTVSDNILFATHAGASLSMRKILDGSFNLHGLVDGDIWISFNQSGVDSTVQKSDSGGSRVFDANYIQVKKAGMPIDKGAIDDQIVAKIKSYVPDDTGWKALK